MTDCSNKLTFISILACLAVFPPASAPAAAGTVAGTPPVSMALPAKAMGFPRHGKVIELTSPDGRIRFSFQNTPSGPQYSIDFNRTRIVDHSPLGLSFQETGDFQKRLVVHQPVYRDGEDNYNLVVGKAGAVHDFYREVEIPLEEQAGSRRQVHVFRSIHPFDGRKIGYPHRRKHLLSSGWRPDPARLFPARLYLFP